MLGNVVADRSVVCSSCIDASLFVVHSHWFFGVPVRILISAMMRASVLILRLHSGERSSLVVLVGVELVVLAVLFSYLASV